MQSIAPELVTSPHSAAKRWPMKKTKATSSKPVELPAFEPDAWERFERAVSMVTKAPPTTPPRQTIISVGSGRQDSESPVRSGIKILESELYSKVADGTKA